MKTILLKILTLLISALLIVGMTACSSKDKQEPSTISSREDTNDIVEDGNKQDKNQLDAEQSDKEQPNEEENNELFDNSEDDTGEDNPGEEYHLNPQFDLPGDYSLIEESDTSEGYRKVYQNKLKTSTIETITGDIYSLSMEDAMNSIEGVTWLPSDSTSDVQGYLANSALGVFYPEGKPEFKNGIPEVDPGTYRYFIIEITDEENEERCIVKLEMDTYLISFRDFANGLATASGVYVKERTAEEQAEARQTKEEMLKLYEGLPSLSEEGMTCEGVILSMEKAMEDLASQFNGEFNPEGDFGLDLDLDNLFE